MTRWPARWRRRSWRNGSCNWGVRRSRSRYRCRSTSNLAGAGVTPNIRGRGSAMLRIEFTRLTKNAGPLTKKISLAPDGTLVKDGSACVMKHGTAERVRLAGVDALGALIEALTPSQAIALGALRADLPDRVEITTKKKLIRPRRCQHRLSRRATSVCAAGLRQQGHADRCCGQT